jgi:hypothetical protein
MLSFFVVGAVDPARAMHQESFSLKHRNRTLLPHSVGREYGCTYAPKSASSLLVCGKAAYLRGGEIPVSSVNRAYHTVCSLFSLWERLNPLALCTKNLFRSSIATAPYFHIAHSSFAPLFLNWSGVLPVCTLNNRIK